MLRTISWILVNLVVVATYALGASEHTAIIIVTHMTERVRSLGLNGRNIALKQRYPQFLHTAVR